MTVAETLAGIVIAGLALYGVGLPAAWLLPAPSDSPWLHRIAIAPVYAIVVAMAGAWLLGRIGIPLHPLQLVVLAGALWAIAWRTTGARWGLKAAMRAAGWPLAMVAAASTTWISSLLGYGLYLPNRDFKNHAYFVAQVASNRSADSALVLRTSPVADPGAPTFYPLGLHTLLGWALPTPGFNAVAVTAAAAVIVSAVSMPLALVVLARMWDPENRSLPLIAGLAGTAFPGVTGGFAIGSVVLIAGTALYTSALACLWLWVREPGVATSSGLAIAGLGLFLLHVAEAAGLLMTAVACAPLALRSRSVRIPWRPLLAAAVVVAALVVVGLEPLRRLVARASAAWDVSQASVSPLFAWISPFVTQPGGPAGAALAWTCLVFAGIWLTRSGTSSSFLLVALAVPLVLSFVAEARGIPHWLGILTAPWYGISARVSLLAVAPIVLLGALPLSRGLGSSRRGVGALAAAGVVAVAALAASTVQQRRVDLASALAGAGDTAALAEALAGELPAGATVLNFEGDGTANLFAFARVPVLDAFALDETSTTAPTEPEFDWVQRALLRLDEPPVAQRLAELRVAYIAVGTTTRYWEQELAYDWRMLAAQPQLSLAFRGSDMVVLRYLEASR